MTTASRSRTGWRRREGTCKSTASCTQPGCETGLADRLRKLIVVAPVAMFVFCLFLRGGLLDGRAGLFYAMQRMTAEVILSLYLLAEHLGIDSHE